MGGADLGRQYIAAGLVDEISIHPVPVLFGSGTRCLTTPQGTRGAAGGRHALHAVRDPPHVPHRHLAKGSSHDT
jgi:riboflavin biosynthesis pyrimidine reductase